MECHRHSYQDWKLENCASGVSWWWHSSHISWHFSLLILLVHISKFNVHDTPTEIDLTPLLFFGWSDREIKYFSFLHYWYYELSISAFCVIDWYHGVNFLSELFIQIYKILVLVREIFHFVILVLYYVVTDVLIYMGTRSS